MKVRKIHRLLGITMLLPFLGWSVTGFVFFIKPGYSGAYEMLTPKTYPLENNLSVAPGTNWKEVKYLKTVLGQHLLVRTETGWQQLDSLTKSPVAKPSDADLRLLIRDAFSVNPKRYGEIVSVEGDTFKTSTGVEVALDWASLSLQQKGSDTELIDKLYKIHYLQWTGQKSVDKVLGFLGLLFVVTLTFLGAWLAVKRNA